MTTYKVLKYMPEIGCHLCREVTAGIDAPADLRIDLLVDDRAFRGIPPAELVGKLVEVESVYPYIAIACKPRIKTEEEEKDDEDEMLLGHPGDPSEYGDS